MHHRGDSRRFPTFELRYRLTWLRKNRVHANLERFWMGHENETVGDGYSKMKEELKDLSRFSFAVA